MPAAAIARGTGRRRIVPVGCMYTSKVAEGLPWG